MSDASKGGVWAGQPSTPHQAERSGCDANNENCVLCNCDTQLFLFPRCFATSHARIPSTRWLYVLLQGICLGIIIDVLLWAFMHWLAEKLAKLENHPTANQYHHRRISLVQSFVWLGYFYWFLMLAFVYVPFGQEVQDFIRE